MTVELVDGTDLLRLSLAVPAIEASHAYDHHNKQKQPKKLFPDELVRPAMADITRACNCKGAREPTKPRNQKKSIAARLRTIAAHAWPFHSMQCMQLA